MDSKAIIVSDDLSIITYPSGTGMTLMSKEGTTEGLVFVNWTELPALLAALTSAAEAMGVETVQAKLAKALGLAIEYMTTIACDPNHLVLTECRKALAAVGQE